LLRAFVALASVAVAVAAAYVAASDHTGTSTHDATLFRVSTIAFLIVAGICAQPARIPARMAALLTLGRLTSCLWLLNGASNRLLF
jgi:hypothetical protein